MTAVEMIIGIYQLHLDVVFPNETFEPLPKFTVEEVSGVYLVVFAGHLSDSDFSKLAKAVSLFVDHTGVTVRLGNSIITPDHSKLSMTIQNHTQAN